MNKKTSGWIRWCKNCLEYKPTYGENSLMCKDCAEKGWHKRGLNKNKLKKICLVTHALHSGRIVCDSKVDKTKVKFLRITKPKINYLHMIDCRNCRSKLIKKYNLKDVRIIK